MIGIVLLQYESHPIHSLVGRIRAGGESGGGAECLRVTETTPQITMRGFRVGIRDSKYDSLWRLHIIAYELHLKPSSMLKNPQVQSMCEKSILGN